jgi:SAM-dependent MidA family methyltransferase
VKWFTGWGVEPVAVRWRDAMQEALYGPNGFFVSGAGPGEHFRTSVHASTAFAAAVLRLAEEVDAALGRPDPFDLIDVGAGRAELLSAVRALANESLLARMRLTAVELAPRPADLPADIAWERETPAGGAGLLLATEWLDNVAVDVVRDGRYVLVEPSTGEETSGGTVDGDDAGWLGRWWPDADRAEVGRGRDEAWAGAVAALNRGLALAVDYGHLRGERPVAGTLAGFRYGRQVPPALDGSCDITAHVAMDSAAAAGAEVARQSYTLIPQWTALRALGVRAGRPPLTLAAAYPAGYVQALADASTAAELTDAAGLGGHWWLFQPVGLPLSIMEVRGGPARAAVAR